MKTYDIVIVGAGAAGMTAAIYTARKGLKTIILSVDVGGQTNMTNHIENYPGVAAMDGKLLMQKFQEQAINFGAELGLDKVVKLEKIAEKQFKVTGGSGEVYEAKAVILAFGKVPRRLNIPGEEKFWGRGVSTCVTCDAPLFRGKTVAVAGGGNSAFEGALELAGIADKVYLVHRRDKFRADKITVDKVMANDKIETIINTKIAAIHGDKFVERLTLEHKESGEQKDIAVNGMFLEIGSVLDTSFVKDMVDTNEAGEIITNKVCATSMPGIFACGDVTDIPYKQTVISAGEGSKAALEAFSYLNDGEITVDWDHNK